MTNKYSGTIIGLIFSVSSWLTTWTFIIPFITVLPLSLILEDFFQSGTNSYSEIGPSILRTLWVIFLTTTIIFYGFTIIRVYRGKPATKLLFILFLVGQLFVVHPLMFYIDTSKNWSRASDGQFILGIIETFPVSSFAFVVFGILLDLVRLIPKPKQEGDILSTNT